jgi:hypothetical protein
MGAHRVVKALALGAAVVVVLLGTARFTNGLVAASAFILALVAIPVAVGIALAYAWNAWELRRSVPGLRVPRSLRRHGVRTCVTCLQPMNLEDGNWICARCSDDRALT